MILLPVIWAALRTRGMTVAEVRALSEADLAARVLALEAEFARHSDNPFREVLTPTLAAVVARRLKHRAGRWPGPDSEP